MEIWCLWFESAAPKRKRPRPVKYDDENPAVQNSPISSTAKVVADQPAKSRPVNDESESRNVQTSKKEPQSPKKEPTGIILDDKREEITLTKPDVKLKRRGLNQSSIYLTNNSTFKEDGENQDPNLSTPPMNQAKAMKATIKSSTEKKQPIESTTPNNEVSVERLSSMKKYVFGLGSAQVSRHPDAATVVTGVVGCAGLKESVANKVSGNRSKNDSDPWWLNLPYALGPLVQKSFNSWAVTKVVEYFHLLPYAAIL
ncbi:hypothetical protein ACFX2J_046569 [Malus domestica]